MIEILMKDLIKNYSKLSLKWMLFSIFLIRLIFLMTALDFDKEQNVYFDIDYEVFTDGARYVLEGKGPYE